MNTLIKPMNRKNRNNFGYLKCLNGETYSLNSSFPTTEAVQDSASPNIVRRPLPPAKPPMRLG